MRYHSLLSILAASLAASAVLPLASEATVIVQTFSYDSSDYSGSIVTNGFSNNPIDTLNLTDNYAAFDTAVGTLDSVTIDMSLTFRIDWTDPSPSSSPSISGGVDIYFDKGGANEQKIYGTGGGNGTAPSSSGSLTMSMHTTGTTPGDFTFDLSKFNSPYTISLFSSSLDVGGSNGATVDYQLESGTMSLTYNYTQAVPEPATYGAFAGLGVLGLALLRRRR